MKKTAKPHCLSSQNPYKALWEPSSFALNVENTYRLEELSEDSCVGLIQSMGATEALHSAADPGWKAIMEVTDCSV